MTIYYVDDGGDGTQANGSDGSWATADTSINDADVTITFAFGDIVYFGHDHVCQATNAAHLTVTGPAPAAGLNVKLISATQGSSPVAYQASSTNQIDTSEGAYRLIFTGAFDHYGMSYKSGSYINFNYGTGGVGCRVEGCRLAPAANADIKIPEGAGAEILFHNTLIDLTADGTSGRTSAVFSMGTADRAALTATGLSFTNAGYRTGTIFAVAATAQIRVSASDFSGFTNGTLCELVNLGANGCNIQFSNCLTAATWGPTSGVCSPGTVAQFVNCGPADAPTYLYEQIQTGACLSTTAIYRSGGATIEGDAVGWLITTTDKCYESKPHMTPWIYGTVASTGSKTFDVYITNDTADFTDAKVWLEVEYLATADEAQTAVATDRIADIVTAAAAQTDDTTSTWNGTGPSFTYKQKLSVTATVNETGLYRARVHVAATSIASSSYFYVDPNVTVS